MSAALGTVRPASADDCARILAEANGARRTVRVRGAGTKDYLGDLSVTDVVVETAALAGIVDHVPADLTVTVAAGTRVAELQRMLEAAGQFLPLDPPHGDAATIGGVIGANSSGFWRARYGGVRDLLIGATIVLADGSIAHAGGRVVKNVAGYDLDKLLIGSLGTLAVIVECTFKVLPLPRARAGLRARFRRGADAFAAADAVMRTPARPSALVVETGARDEWRMHVQASGDPSAIERTVAIAAEAAAAGGASERNDDVAATLAPLRELPAKREGAVVRASLPPAAQPAFADVATRLDGFDRLIADAASATVRVHVTGGDDDVVAAADALLAAARVCGGSARVERRHERLRSRIAAWGDGDLPGLFLMRRLKDAFDPNGILEPGRGVIR